jgi:hypothetical protein
VQPLLLVGPVNLIVGISNCGFEMGGIETCPSFHMPTAALLRLRFAVVSLVQAHSSSVSLAFFSGYSSVSAPSYASVSAPRSGQLDNGC